MRWPTCKCLWRGSGWRCGGRKGGLCSPFWVSFIGRFGLEAWHALLRRLLIVGSVRSGLGIPLWLSLSPWWSCKRWLLSPGEHRWHESRPCVSS